MQHQTKDIEAERQASVERQNEAMGLIATLLDAAPVGFAFLDTELRFRTINRRLAALNGRPVAEHIGRTLAEILPQLSARAEPLIRQVIATGKPLIDWEVSSEPFNLPGGPFYNLVSYYPVRTPDGQLLGVGVTVTDITERKRTEEAVRRSEERYRALVQATTMAVWSTDATGQNAATTMWETLTGRPSAEGAASGWLDALHPDDRERAQVAWQQAIKTHTLFDTVFRVLARDGSYHHLAVRGVPLFDSDGRLHEWIGTFNDITARKRAEEGLAFLSEASRVLASSFDYQTTLARVARLAIPQLADWCAVDIVQADGSITPVVIAHRDQAREQEALENRQRYPLDPATPVGPARVIRTGQAELLADIPAELLATVARSEQELAVLQAEGYRSMIAVPLISRGQIIGALTFATTASGRSYDHSDLQLAEELARRAAVTIDNARLYQEAQEAVRMRDAFLAIAAHELKNPLTSLLGQAHLIQLRTQREGTLGERDQQALQTIQEQASRLAVMITDLLDFSHLEREQLSIIRAPLDLGALTRRIIAEIQPATPGHLLASTLPNEPMVIAGDALRLEQVIHNLIGNAIKYSPRGGTVGIQLERRDTMAWLAISDQGIGIPVDALPSLFQPFYRAANASRHGIRGVGVGLYIVKQIITLHGGHITVESVEGVGSSFRICLPLHGIPGIAGGEMC